MPLDLLPALFVCAPVGKHLAQRLGPYHGYAKADAPKRPLFTSEVAELIAADWKALPAPHPLVEQEAPPRGAPRGGTAAEADAGGAPGPGPRYDAHYNPVDGAFWFYDAEADAWHAWAGEDVGLATLYPIGEGAWRWDCRS